MARPLGIKTMHSDVSAGSNLISTTATICLLFFTLGAVKSAEAKQKPLAVNANWMLVKPARAHRLVVKFRDNIQASAEQGKLTTTSVAAKQLCEKLATEHHARFEQLIQIDAEKLENICARALACSGRAQSDLTTMMVVSAPDDQLQNIAKLLDASQVVQWVEFETLNPEPPVFMQECQDIAPATPTYAANQNYRQANPGLNLDAFWGLGNGRGAGVNIADVEYWFNSDHEDLCGVNLEPGQTPASFIFVNNWHQHGSASLGQIIGGDNDFGVLGLAPDAGSYFFSEWTVEQGSRRATAIANAASTLNAGDVILLEMQTMGSTGCGPAELNAAVWEVVRTATDAGIIVVAAAGNGSQDLDDSSYAAYRARGDSGAILVGAGSASLNHNRLSFSTFGSRVNVQGWGQSVFTAGYGYFSEIGGDENQNYTNSFGGTSSASSMIAGVCVALQSYAEAEIGRRLTPTEMRLVLTETGWPQGSGGNIGRFPNMLEAAKYILDLAPEFELGDVNLDGATDFLDIGPFINLLASGSFQTEGDINSDGTVDFLDIAGFIDLLSVN